MIKVIYVLLATYSGVDTDLIMRYEYDSIKDCVLSSAGLPIKLEYRDLVSISCSKSFKFQEE